MASAHCAFELFSVLVLQLALACYAKDDKYHIAYMQCTSIHVWTLYEIEVRLTITAPRLEQDHG